MARELHDEIAGDGGSREEPQTQRQQTKVPQLGALSASERHSYTDVEVRSLHIGVALTEVRADFAHLRLGMLMPSLVRRTDSQIELIYVAAPKLAHRVDHLRGVAEQVRAGLVAVE